MMRRQGIQNSSKCSFSIIFILTVLFGAFIPAMLCAQSTIDTEKFAGRVVFEGKPVTGADVYLGKRINVGGSEYRQELKVAARTDQDGRFSFARPGGDPASTSYCLIVRKSGLSDGVARIDARIDPGNVVIELFPPSVLSGVVRSSDGKPLEGAEVRINGSDTRDASGKMVISNYVNIPVFTTLSDKEGRFTIQNVPVNLNLTVGASKAGYQEKWSEAQSGTTDAVLTLEPGGTISGRVTNAKTGAPVAGVEVETRGATSVRTDKDGRYLIQGLAAAGYYQLQFVPDFSRSDVIVGTIDSLYVPHAGTVDNADIALKEGIVITGIVIDKGTGLPMARSAVSALIPRNPPAAPPVGKPEELSVSENDVIPISGMVVDDEGRFRLVAVPGYVILKVVMLDERNSRNVTVNEERIKRLYIDADSKPEDIRFEISPAVTVRGVVYLPDGKPAARVIFRTGGFSEVITNQRGEFTLSGLSAGRTFTITAEQRELGLEASVTVDPTSTDTLRVYLKPYRYTSVFGKIIDHTGSPVVGEPIEIYISGGLISLENARAAVSGPDGSFMVDSLRVGKNYIVGARKNQVRSQGFTASSSNQPVELILPKADRWMSGRVLDEKSTPMSGVNVSISSGPSGLHQTVTGKDGRFRLEGIVGVTEDINVEGFLFENIATNSDHEYVLGPKDRYLGGRVVDEQGKPIINARVTAVQSLYAVTWERVEKVTDSLGRFWMGNLNGETTRVIVLAEGYQNLMTDQKTNVDNVEYVLRKK
jgi:hypothetical protein